MKANTMKTNIMYRTMILTLCVLWLTGGMGRCWAGQTNPATIVLYDTLEPAGLGETEKVLPPEGKGTRFEGGATPQAIKGDALLMNGSLAVLVLGDGSGVVLYAKGEEGWNRRGRLALVVNGAPATLTSLQGSTDPEKKYIVTAGVQGVDGAGVTLELVQGGFPAVKATMRGKLDALRFIVPCRLGIAPDFWTDDLMIDARSLPIERLDLPSGNIFLHLAGEGDAIVAAVWEQSDRDIEVALEGEGDERMIAATDIFASGETGVWAAVLEQKNIWHQAVFKPKETKKLDWAVPFIAKWKGNIALSDGTALSRLFKYKPAWHDGRVDVLSQKRDELSAVFKQEWKRFLGFNSIFDVEGVVPDTGTVIAVYPISREGETPLDQYCTDDLLRLLGTEICTYVLDLDGRTGESKPGVEKGIFTCAESAIMPAMMPQTFPRNERAVARFLKDERVYRRLINAEVLLFLGLVQNRINSYVNFRKELLVYLDEEEKKHPEFADFIGRLREHITKRVPVYGSPRQEAMKLANGVELATPLIERRLKPLEVDTPENAAASLFDLRSIGDHQDGRVQGERLKVARLRVMATMEMARNPATRELAEEIRKRVQVVLRNPTTFEKPQKW